ACTCRLEHRIKAFCFECKAPTPPNWTTGNKSLDSFIIKSWKNTKDVDDTYIQRIEYSLLTDVQQRTSLHHGCTCIADWLEPKTNKLTRVTLKKIVIKGD